MKKLVITSLLLFVAFQLSFSQDGNSEWTLNGTNMGRLYCGVIDPANQSTMYVAGLDSGIFKTVNGGLNWVAINNGLLSKKIQCIAISPSSPGTLYAGTDSLGTVGTNGVYKTTNGGANWTLMIGGLTEISVQSLVVHPTNPNIVWACLFNAVGPAAVGLWKTTNGGTNWFASNTGIASDNKNVLAIAINPLNPNVLYVGTSLVLPGSTGPSKIYKSFDGGASWNLFSNGLPALTTDNNPVRALQVLRSDTNIVGAALFVNALTGGFFLSTNGGQLWTKKHDGLPAVVGSLLRSIYLRSATEFYVGMDGGTTTKGVWRTTNGGNNWVDFNNTVMTNTHPVRVLMFKTSGANTLFAGAAGTTVALTGVYEYSWPPPVPSGTWTEQTSPVTTELNSVSAVDDDVCWASGAAGKVVRTTNKGATWTNVSGDMPTTNPGYVIWGFDANNAVVTTSPSAGAGTRIFKTTNGGTNWVQTFYQSDGWGDGFYFINATTGFFYGDHTGTRLSIFKTTNGGTNWDSTGMFFGTTADGWNNAMFGLGNQIWIGTNSTTMVYSSNAGVNWTAQTTPVVSAYGIWFNSPTKGIGGGASLYKTTNSGTNWATLTSPIANNLTGVCGAETSWWFTAFTALVYTSSNDGVTWSTAYTAPASTGTYRHLTKARNGSTIWGVRTLGGISRFGTPIVGVTPISENIPINYKLSQNYPNPFNPVTKINFAIPKSGLVTLKIYDMLGREVNTVINEFKNAGTYSFNFDGSQLSSGTYFYRLQSGEFTATKRMMLIK